ncbi:MAG: hypothetical protein PHV06_02390 [bacterium]|nr:hypothetical protein [bacterium]
MSKASIRTFIIVFLAALLIGGVVLLVKPDYRPEKILETNSSYYPDYKVCE